MKYEDFIIRIGPDRGAGHSVSVLKSPAGEGEGVFRNPFQVDQLGRMLESLGHPVEGSREVSLGLQERELDLDETEGTDPTPRVTPRDLGQQLFRSLFSGQVGTLFDQSLGMLQVVGDRGLRIKLKLNPRHPELALLSSLPWEFLHRAETEDFLCLSRKHPVVRYLDVPRPNLPPPLPGVLRVLVVISSPRGHGELDLDRERREIETAFQGQSRVEMTFLPAANLDALCQALLCDSFHVLHFMGHGGFESDGGQGVLFFEGPGRRPDPVSGRALATWLKDSQDLRLVLLNACNTARATGSEGLNPFAGVATALVLGGLPAVLAMQFPISDAAAIVFSRAFYQRLTVGDPVDAATGGGRLAIYQRDRRSVEWGTPVLFMRSPDGHLFAPPQGASSRETLDVAASRLPGLGAQAESPVPAVPTVSERVEERLRRARRLADSGEIDDAHLEIRDALRLDPDNMEAREVLESLAEEIESRDRQHRLQQAARQIGEALELGDLSTASRVLEAAMATFGEVEPLIELRSELAAARQLDRAARLADTARQLVVSEELDSALETAMEAERLDPDSNEIARVLAHIRERLDLREAERRQHREVARLAELVRNRLDEGNREAASALLDDAEASLGSQPVFQELRERLEELERDARRERLVLQVDEVRRLLSENRFHDAFVSLLTARRSADDPTVIDELQVVAERAARRFQRQEQRREFAEQLAAWVKKLWQPEKVWALALGLKQWAIDALSWLQEHSFLSRARQQIAAWRGAAARLVGTLITRVRQRPLVGKRFGLLATGVAVLTLGMALGLERVPHRLVEELEPVEEQGPPSSHGRLILTSGPWGEVEISRLDGEGPPKSKETFTHTPLAVSLLPGCYRVEIINEHFGRPLSREVEIFSDETIRLQMKFEGASADELLDQLGW